VASVCVPVTLKIRTGPSPEQRNGVQIARIAQEEGVAALAVHGRTRSDRFRGDAEYDTIAEIVDTVSIPVIANGDITSAAQAQDVLEYTGAAGVMVGRAAQGNPWVFREIVAGLEGRRIPPRPTTDEIGETLMEHLRGCHELYGDYRGVRIARKHIAWYCRGMRDSAAFRESVNKAETPVRQLDLVARFFEQPACKLVAA